MNFRRGLNVFLQENNRKVWNSSEFSNKSLGFTKFCEDIEKLRNTLRLARLPHKLRKLRLSEKSGISQIARGGVRGKKDLM